MQTSRDPREIITPDSFAIDPTLLGLPLARPTRRAVAMLLDLLIIALLVNAGGFLFGLAAAWVFFRVSGKSAGGGLLLRSWRLAFRSLAAIVLFSVVVSAWGSWRRAEPPRREPAGDVVLGLDALALGADALSFRQARSEEEGLAAARNVAAQLREQGFASREIQQILEQAADAERQPWAPRIAVVATRPAAKAQSAAGAVAADSLLQLYAEAFSTQDTGALSALRPKLQEVLAADTVAVLQTRGERLSRENRQLREALEEAREERGILSFMRASADDLGLTFGWAGLYFTAFLALWRGQTPGKRVMRIRVVRLDGKPMTWWASFERFGGYAASIFTGLLGFVQIIWDRNRQGMHDKITETVVVRE